MCAQQLAQGEKLPRLCFGTTAFLQTQLNTWPPVPHLTQKCTACSWENRFAIKETATWPTCLQFWFTYQKDSFFLIKTWACPRSRLMMPFPAGPSAPELQPLLSLFDSYANSRQLRRRTRSLDTYWIRRTENTQSTLPCPPQPGDVSQHAPSKPRVYSMYIHLHIFWKTAIC